MSNTEWTEARYFNFLRTTFRRGFQRYPLKYQALKRAKVGTKQFECASCKEIFRQKDIKVDHIKPCGKLRSYDDIARFVTTLFCGLDNLQILCDKCHNHKTLLDKGYTELDIHLLRFRQLKADEQKAILRAIKIEPGSNQEIRTTQYKESLNGQPSKQLRKRRPSK